MYILDESHGEHLTMYILDKSLRTKGIPIKN